MLRRGADPNYINSGSDLTLFWAIDGGVEVIKLLHTYGADLDARTPKDWTPLSYCRAKGKYGATEEKGIYPEVPPRPALRWPHARARTRPAAGRPLGAGLQGGSRQDRERPQPSSPCRMCSSFMARPRTAPALWPWASAAPERATTQRQTPSRGSVAATKTRPSIREQLGLQAGRQRTGQLAHLWHRLLCCQACCHGA